jgi:7-keto-8-aminopelargonate synthetase-like enzyme
MESIAPTDGPYVIYEGKKLLDFSSCDFLGLAQHPEVKKNAIKYALKYGVGATANSTPQREVESKLAHYLGKEAALLFSSTSELFSQLEKLGATILSTDTDNLASFKKAKGLKVADETYLLGMIGASGFGTSTDLADAVCGSLLSGSCAFIAGAKKQLAQLTHSAINFPLLGALDCAFSFIPEMEHERKMIVKHKSWLMKALGDFSVKELKSPRVLLTSDQAELMRKFFIQEQIYLAPSKDNTLSFSMTALHTPDDLDQLTVALKRLTTTDLALAMQSLTPTP